MFVPDMDICNYADDTTLWVSDTDTIQILNKLESFISTVASWFIDNCMRLNREKCRFMVFGDQSNDWTLQIETIPVVESTEQKLLGITVEKKLTFKHTLNLYVRRQIKSSMLFPVFRATSGQSNWNLQWKRSIYRNLTTALSCGCSVAEPWTIKYIEYMKRLCASHPRIKQLTLTPFCLNETLYQYTKETCSC